MDISLDIPTDVFIDFDETDCVGGFEWVNEEKIDLKPTMETMANKQFKYTISKPSLLNTLWHMEEYETLKRGTEGRQSKSVLAGAGLFEAAPLCGGRGAWSAAQSDLTGDE